MVGASEAKLAVPPGSGGGTGSPAWDKLKYHHGLPEVISTDNEYEFRSRHMHRPSVIPTQ